MLGDQFGILVATEMEFFEPHVAANMDVCCPLPVAAALSAHPLLYDSAMQDEGFCSAVLLFILQLCHAEKGCVRHLEPVYWLHDAEVVGTRAAC